MWSMRSNTESRRLLDRFETRIWPVAAADLRARPAVDHHDVGREVVLAAQERRADAVGVDRYPQPLELADLVRREATRGDDPHALVARGVERVAHLLDERRVHAGRPELAHLVPQGPVDKSLG